MAQIGEVTAIREEVVGVGKNAVPKNEAPCPNQKNLVPMPTAHCNCIGTQSYMQAWPDSRQSRKSMESKKNEHGFLYIMLASVKNDRLQSLFGGAQLQYITSHNTLKGHHARPFAFSHPKYVPPCCMQNQPSPWLSAKHVSTSD
mmetsp:Transcript_9810/g.20757  ORF Transcript_9810/g.20757 Transcript_9810/m.20757 type:complete len:144 (+) Transcript_9810:17-448(+)